MRLFDEIRYFFYITNDRKIKAEGVVFEANDRCGGELDCPVGRWRAGGMSAPVDNLAEQLGVHGRHGSGLPTSSPGGHCGCPRRDVGTTSMRRKRLGFSGMEFKTFLNAFIKIPCQNHPSPVGNWSIAYSGFNPNLSVFFRMASVLRC